MAKDSLDVIGSKGLDETELGEVVDKACWRDVEVVADGKQLSASEIFPDDVFNPVFSMEVSLYDYRGFLTEVVSDENGNLRSRFKGE